MSGSSSATKPQFYFENDVSGRLFRWLIGARKFDLDAMIDHALRKDPGAKKAVKRLAEALQQAVADARDWARTSQKPPSPEEFAEGVPAYRLWYRPDPSKSIRYKEVAEALLVFAGRLPPAAQD